RLETSIRQRGGRPRPVAGGRARGPSQREGEGGGSPRRRSGCTLRDRVARFLGRAGGRRMRGTRAVIAATVVLLLLAACGVPLDDDPREISVSSTSNSEITPTTQADPDGSTARIYLVDSNGGLRADEASLETPGVAGAVS